MYYDAAIPAYLSLSSWRERHGVVQLRTSVVFSPMTPPPWLIIQHPHPQRLTSLYRTSTEEPLQQPAPLSESHDHQCLSLFCLCSTSHAKPSCQAPDSFANSPLLQTDRPRIPYFIFIFSFWLSEACAIDFCLAALISHETRLGRVRQYVHPDTASSWGPIPCCGA
jgi:hypothetical protein